MIFADADPNGDGGASQTPVAGPFVGLADFRLPQGSGQESEFVVGKTILTGDLI